MIESGQQIIDRLRAENEYAPALGEDPKTILTEYEQELEAAVRDLADRLQAVHEQAAELIEDSPRLYRDQVVAMLADPHLSTAVQVARFFQITDEEIEEMKRATE